MFDRSREFHLGWYFLWVLAAFAMILAAGCAREKDPKIEVIPKITSDLTGDSIPGLYEGIIVDRAAAEELGIETHIFRIDLKADGSISYVEFHDSARKTGVLGTEKSPACIGKWTLRKDGILDTALDCSRVKKGPSAHTRQEIDMRKVNFADLETTDGALVHVESYKGDNTRAYLMAGYRIRRIQ